jgi:hypothetical protein
MMETQLFWEIHKQEVNEDAWQKRKTVCPFWFSSPSHIGKMRKSWESSKKEKRRRYTLDEHKAGPTPNNCPHKLHVSQLQFILIAIYCPNWRKWNYRLVTFRHKTRSTPSYVWLLL